ncbi:MAG: AlpA family phage regulatory protein [Halioglobus sp.]|nr:AlpA family phage regulatory protein [Halioglobus sp.]
MAQSPDSSNKLIRLPQVQEIVPYSRSTIYALIARGEFPAPVKLAGGRASAWVLAEVLDHAAERISERQPA